MGYRVKRVKRTKLKSQTNIKVRTESAKETEGCVFFERGFEKKRHKPYKKRHKVDKNNTGLEKKDTS